MQRPFLFSEEYQDKVDAVKKQIEKEIREKREQARYDEVFPKLLQHWQMRVWKQILSSQMQMRKSQMRERNWMMGKSGWQMAGSNFRTESAS